MGKTTRNCLAFHKKVYGNKAFLYLEYTSNNMEIEYNLFFSKLCTSKAFTGNV